MTGKEKQSVYLTTICIAGLIAVLLTAKVFSPSNGPGTPQPTTHPSSVQSASPALLSCLDLQRELNRMDPKLKLKEDGICGPATQRAWDEYVFNGYALELWPEDAK